MSVQQSTSTVSLNRPRYLLLDLLRIFAALWVVLFHWGTHAASMSHAPPWFQIGFRAGYLGVDIFFMLSGAVIAYTAIGRTWGAFGVARFLRLAPVFFGVTVLTIVFLFVQGELTLSPMDWLNLTGLHFFFNVPSVVTVAWTLYYELGFYVLIGLLILLSKNRLTTDGLRKGATVFLMVALVAQFTGNQELTMFTLSGFGGMFAFGALLGTSRTKEQLQKNLPPLILATALTYAKLTERTGQMGLGDTATTLWSLGILIIVGGTILLSAMRQIDIRHPGLRKGIATFAMMTYPLYLLHLEIGLGSVALMRDAGVPMVVTAAIAAVLMLFLSWIFVRYFEPWARRWLRRAFGWTTKPNPPTTSTEPENPEQTTRANT